MQITIKGQMKLAERLRDLSEAGRGACMPEPHPQGRNVREGGLALAETGRLALRTRQKVYEGKDFNAAGGERHRSISWNAQSDQSKSPALNDVAPGLTIRTTSSGGLCALWARLS